MFANAYKMASEFTFPVVISARYFDGTIEGMIGTFVAINSNRWFVTVAHIFDPYITAMKHEKEIAAYKEEVQGIQNKTNISAHQKKNLIKRLPKNPKWITNISYWWAGLGEIDFQNNYIYNNIDLAVFRLQSTESLPTQLFPVFKNPKKLDHGTSLCKLGFPFLTIETQFDEATGTFAINPLEGALIRFPIEGIYTRYFTLESDPNARYVPKFLETSSPGFRGQSGGPIFDRHGNVWAIQSQTRFLDLGFAPEVAQGGRRVTEHQFLNVGWGVHPELLVQVFRDHGISFRMTDE